MEKEVKRKKMQGKVVSTSMTKTISVKVENYITHPKYNKRILRTKKFLAHDEKEEANINDIVEIVECRPLSRRKTFRLLKVIDKGVGGQVDTRSN